MGKIRRKLKRAFIPHNENKFLPTFIKPRSLFILAVVLLLIKFLIFSWYFYFPRTIEFAIVTSSRLTELANTERVAAGLQPLKTNEKLVQAAIQKAQDMLNKNYFAHTSPTGVMPWYWLDRTGYKYVAAGENLAKDFTDSEILHQAWMDSSTHKANILNKKYQEIGIAVIEGEINGKRTVLAVEFFGKSPSLAQTVVGKTESKPVAISNTDIELETVAGEETPKTEAQKGINLLKGPDVFKQSLKEIVETPKNILNIVTEKSETIVQKTYFVILGLLILVLMLTIFINIRVQYPKVIFTALIFIVLIAAMALFNGKEFVNRGIEVLCASL